MNGVVSDPAEQDLRAITNIAAAGIDLQMQAQKDVDEHGNTVGLA